MTARCALLAEVTRNIGLHGQVLLSAMLISLLKRRIENDGQDAIVEDLVLWHPELRASDESET